MFTEYSNVHSAKFFESHTIFTVQSSLNNTHRWGFKSSANCLNKFSSRSVENTTRYKPHNDTHGANSITWLQGKMKPPLCGLDIAKAHIIARHRWHRLVHVKHYIEVKQVCARPWPKAVQEQWNIFVQTNRSRAMVALTNRGSIISFLSGVSTILEFTRRRFSNLLDDTPRACQSCELWGPHTHTHTHTFH